jgi:histidyl-tRNA synthetase
MIVVDSSVWIDYFNGKLTPQTDTLDDLLVQQRLIVGDLILTEVLQGFKHDKDYRTAEQLRDALPRLRLLTHCGGGSFKNQFKKADKSGARFALVLGDDELAQQQIAIKYLRNEQPQVSIAQTALSGWLAAQLGL